MNDMSDQIQINIQRARQATVADSSKCRTCERAGIPIMPLRYAVLPKSAALDPNLPADPYFVGPAPHAKLAAPTLGQGVIDTPLEKYNYGLRTLREGFLYVYLEAHDVWQTYAVTPQGHLTICRDHTKPTVAETQELDHPCIHKAHDVAASFIHIPNIKSTPVIWLAFSQDAWTKKVLNNYRKPDLREKRMTKLDLTAFKTAPTKQPHAFEIDPSLQSLHANVEEYARTEDEGIERGGWMAERYEFGETKTHDKTRKDHPVWSVHRFWSRHDRLGETKRVVINTKKNFQMPTAAVALMDTDGMVQELNHARLKTISDLDTWSRDPIQARKHQTSEAIKALNKLAVEQARQAVAQGAQYKHRYTPMNKAMSFNEFRQQMQSRQLPPAAKFTPDQGYFVDRTYGTVTVTQGMIDADVAGMRDEQQKRAEHRARPVIERYQDRYNESQRSTFESDYRRKLDAYNATLKKLDNDYATWLGSSAWQITANDYEANHTRSGADFANKVGLALAGGGIAEKSLAWWEKTLALAPTDPQNPVYAAIFGKQEKILAHLVPDKLPMSNAEMENSDAKKSSPLYDTVKDLATTALTPPNGIVPVEWVAGKVAHLGQEGISQTKLALAGAMASLDKHGKLTSLMEQTANRAYQAASKVYLNRDVALVTLKLTLEEYRHWLFDQVWGETKKSFNQTSREAKRRVRSVLERGLMAIPDAKTRNTLIQVMVWTTLSTTEINSVLAAYRRGAVRGLDNIMRSVTAHAATLSQPVTQAIGKLEGLSAKDMSQVMRALGTGARNVHEPLFAGGAMYFQYWSLKYSMKDMQIKIGKDRQDALFGVVAASIGLLGAGVEVAGGTIKTAGKVMSKVSVAALGLKLMRVGGAIAAASAVVDAGQSVMAGVRTFKDKDYLATGLYVGAAVALGFGAYIGAKAAFLGAAMLGPVGIALALILLGIGLMYLAKQAESTATENWLKRTVFGSADAKDTFPDPATEMTELNAVIIGLGIEMDFNDDWNQAYKGTDTFNFRVKLPQFDPNLSAYEVVLDLQTDEKATPIRYYQAHSLKTASASGLTLPAPKNIEGMMQISIDIPVKNAIKIAKARVVYWIDRIDPAMEMSTALSVTD